MSLFLMRVARIIMIASDKIYNAMDWLALEIDNLALRLEKKR